MKFRLIYRGELPPNRKKMSVCKHEIRKKFHYQIKNFTDSNKVPDSFKQTPPTKRKNYNFIPVIGKNNRHCSLDILFLRSDIPGNSGFAGDIDNRVKTLLDALRMPLTAQEIPPGESPEQHEEPFFCLLEDDSLVSQLSVEMDHLFDLPSDSDGTSSEVLLIITVNLEPGLLTKGGHLIL